MNFIYNFFKNIFDRIFVSIIAQQDIMKMENFVIIVVINVETVLSLEIFVQIVLNLMFFSIMK
jgi:hypothetical protein